MLQHFIFWRSRNVQQDSVFDHVASANVQSRHSSSPNSKSPGLQELPCVGNAGGRLRREATHTCPHRVRWALLKGCRWERGYKKGSRQGGSWEVSRNWLGVVWLVGEWQLGFLYKGNLMVRCNWGQAEERESLWQWGLSFGSELWWLTAGVAAQGAVVVTEPREWRESALQHQLHVGHSPALGWLKPTDLSQGQKCCLQKRLFKLLICWWLCELLNKRAVFSRRCDSFRWNMLCFVLALSAQKCFWQ